MKATIRMDIKIPDWDQEELSQEDADGKWVNIIYISGNGK